MPSWIGRTGAVAFALAISACTPLGLNVVSTNVASKPPATPPVLGAFEGDPPVASVADWRDRREPELRAAFEKYVYGPVPTELKGSEISRRVVDPAFAGGAGVLEEIDVRVGQGANAPTYRIALALPKTATASSPAPLILEENFCGNPGTMDSKLLTPPATSWSCDDHGAIGAVIRLIFGKYITHGPDREILQRGYAYATVFPSELVDDSSKHAQAGLDRFAAQLPEGRRPTGAIAVWAATFGYSLDVLETDPRIDASRTAAFGHSRHAKAALLAGAFDPRIAAVIAHQSGKGGATLTRAYAGESVKSITKSYPYWFSPAYKTYAGKETAIPVDQHQLIAMMAPRPVLLGNGWRDVWSDPNGSFRAAVGAEAVYRLMGVDGLMQTMIGDTKKRGEIDFYMRPGAHGIRVMDWDYFLDWLDRWLKPGVSGGPIQASR
ncbi:MAG: alpha/beta hydrolase [Alphaproteobacteria bacterium]|nr:alpha/beta hydrolase [Alphaproteobacteria bacterium]